MELTVYDLETQGLAFKRDFNAFERVKKIHEQRDKTGYLKFDLVTEENGALFLVTRTADFTTNIATMKTEWIRDFTHMPVNLGPYEYEESVEPSEDNPFQETLGQIYLVSIQSNPVIRQQFEKEPITGVEHVDINSSKDFNQLSDADLIFFIGENNTAIEYTEDIMSCGNESTVKIALDDSIVLNSLCHSTIKQTGSYEKMYHYLNELAEKIQTPSLFGLDMADVKKVFRTMDEFFIKQYVLDRHTISTADPASELQGFTDGFVAMTFGTNWSVDELHTMFLPIQKIFDTMPSGAKIQENLGDKIIITVYAGTQFKRSTLLEKARMILSEYDPETSFPEREFQEKLTLFGATREQAREVKFALMREGLIYAPRDGELKRF